MKQKYFSIFLILFFLTGFNFNSYSQISAGDLAFVAFNADGDDDFAIVALDNIPANTKIWFTDDEATGATTKDNSEGTVEWDSGNSLIEVGTIIIFSDFDAGGSRTASIGSFTDASGTFNLAGGGDALFAYLGTATTVSTWLAGIQNASGNEGNLTGTGLIEGTNFITFTSGANDDGGIYSGSRVSESSFSNYSSLINNPTNWSTNASDGESFLPFSSTAFTSTATTWDGSTDSEWITSTNWSDGVPHSGSTVTIANVTTAPIISGTTEAVANDLTNNEPDGLTINSGGSLIVSGTYSGTGGVTYTRSLSSGRWYLMSSPVIGETYDNTWFTDNNIASGSAFTSNRAVATYDNGTPTSTAVAGESGYWRYAQFGGSGNFNTAQGYGINTTGTSVSFTGSGIHTTNQTFNITQGTGTDANNFNLVGNPFTGYITLGTFHTTNTAIVADNYFFWVDGGWVTRTNLVDSAHEIAPGQGFIVEASGNGTITFESSDLSDQTDTFAKSASLNRPEIHLNITQGNNKRSARILYIDGTTTGYDSGYDGKLFGGASQNLAIYTHLVSNDEGVRYQLQSLPNSNYENMTIPVGLIANSGTSISFSTEIKNLPENHEVILEDRETNTFERLDNGGTHSITLDNDVNDIGRFFLHTVPSGTLSSQSSILENVSTYVNENKLRIVGVLDENVRLTMYNLLGKEIINTTFNSNGFTEVELPRVSKGLYIVNLVSTKGKLNKKIIIE